MRKTKSIITATAISLLTALSSEAQYMKLVRGEPFPYDTGVATQINTYRQETQFIKHTDTLVTNLVKEVDTLRAKVELLKTLYALEQSKNAEAQRVINSQTDSFKSLLETYEKLNKEALKPKNRGLWFGLGAISAFLITR